MTAVRHPPGDHGTVAADSGPREWADDDVRRRAAWTAVAVAGASTFLFVADSGLMALAIPRIEAEFPNASRNTVAWVASGFMIAQSAFLLVGGRLSDRRGRKRFYLFGLLLFAAGALLTSVAPTVATIIAARVVQGIGAAFLTSGALALVLPMFPPEQAPHAIGVWGMIGSIAGWLTPTAGAVLIAIDWRLGFAAVGPIGVATWIVARRVLTETTPAAATSRTDRLSLILGPAGLAVTMLALSRGNEWGWLSLTTMVVGGLGIGLLTTFVRRCRTTLNSPLVDPVLVQNRRFTANVVAGTMQQIGYYAWFVTCPLIMIGAWGWSVRNAGFAIALSQLPASFGAPIGGFLVRRSGPSRPIVAGAIVTGCGSFWLLATSGSPHHFWVNYLPGALLMGFGGSLCGTITSGTALAALPSTMLGAGNSLQQLIRRMGSAIGVAAGVALLGEADGPAILAGAHRVWAMTTIAHWVMAVPLWLAWRSRVRPV